MAVTRECSGGTTPRKQGIPHLSHSNQSVIETPPGSDYGRAAQLAALSARRENKNLAGTRVVAVRLAGSDSTPTTPFACDYLSPFRGSPSVELHRPLSGRGCVALLRFGHANIHS